MNKTFVAASLVIGALTISLNADNTSASAMKTADCSALSAAEQQFSSQLSSSNQDTFCGKFTSAQRAKAMQMTGQPDSTGAAMSPDASVQKVMKESSSSSQSRSSGGGCPVK